MSGGAFRLPFFSDQSLHQINIPQPPPTMPSKKKRNHPGTPDPEAEVIALSPRTLMATNRFVCEICNKGFQRDQNLQLHRRGHNLPWKLRQRPPGSPPPRKRVYVCPEIGCVHHDPARALGDLTGIKKHFSRKHGEKKWKCERCGKRYAVHSDYKAHCKTCGTREYRCDCGTLFSRKDSFVTHRAFCDALTHEGVAPDCSDNALVAPQMADLSLWLRQSEEAAAAATPSAYLSATALLQKAAQMGVTASVAGTTSAAFFSGLMRSMNGELLGGKGRTRDFLGLGGGGDGGPGGNALEITRFAALTPLSSMADYMSASNSTYLGSGN